LADAVAHAAPENWLKPLVKRDRARKHDLFAGSDTGGERAAVLYSPLGTAKLDGIDPEAYLRHLRKQHRRASDRAVPPTNPCSLVVPAQ
jgi:hypothetical protein